MIKGASAERMAAISARDRKTENKQFIHNARKTLENLGFSTTEELYKVYCGLIICRHCQGDGLVNEVTYIQLTGLATIGALKEAKESDEMHQCPRCIGSGYEDMSSNLRVDALKTLASFVTPKLAAVAIKEDRDQRPLVRRLHAITDELELVDQKNRMQAIERQNIDETGQTMSGLGSDDIEDGEFEEFVPDVPDDPEESTQDPDPEPEPEKPRPVVRRRRPRPSINPQDVVKPAAKKAVRKKPGKAWKS